MKVTEMGLTITLIRTIFVLIHVASAQGGVYNLTDSHRGHNFFDGLEFQALGTNDPTHGRVNYVDATTATKMNLTFSTDDSTIIKVDSTQTLDPSGPGRASIRLASTKAYNTFVLVLQLTHMPQGCGTWPSVWTVGSNWPNQGEIDVIEGTHGVGANMMTLHTSNGCMMPQQRTQLGTTLSTDCNALKNFNEGCGVQSGNPNSFGSKFNDKGGGWFAMEKTDELVNMWTWSTGDPTVPDSVASGDSSIDTSQFGEPDSFFPNTFCNIPGHFGPQNITIDTTLCGDLASVTFAGAGCPGDCNDFVNTQPAAFKDAYWDFKFLNIYQ